MKELPEGKILDVKIKPGFARAKGYPIYAYVKIAKQTERAVFVSGTGNVRDTSVCCKCGRALTHPVSVLLGIGPECGKHYWDWNRVGAHTEDEIYQTKKRIEKELAFQGWIPKSCLFVRSENVPSGVGIKDVDPPENKKIGRVAKKVGDKITVKFDFDRNLIAQVKTIPLRKYNPATKSWSFPVSIEAVKKLKEWEFTMDQELLDYLKQAVINQSQLEEIDLPPLKRELYPFQKKGVAFIEKKKGKALIGDEMGLGKTIQSIAWLALHPEIKPAVIVCPASLKLNWAREIEMTLDGRDVKILDGRQGRIIPDPDILIINYDILPNVRVERTNPRTGRKEKIPLADTGWIDFLIKMKPQAVIYDEVHYLKNSDAYRTKAGLRLAKVCKHVIGLSGTPIVNRPIELYNAIRMIEPGLFPSAWKYKQRYCGAHHNGFGWVFNGATHTDELHAILTSTIMLRRLKKDVLSDLPDKIRSFVPMPLVNQNEYKDAEADFISWLARNVGSEKAERAAKAEALVRIGGLKQLTARGKLKAVTEWIQNHLDSNGKLVVFAVHRFVIDYLMNQFQGIAVKVDGSVSNKARQEAVDRFQKDDTIRLFIGNIKAAGVGLTLTAASSVAFVELEWTPGVHSQAEDRCHRIGQKDAVNIYYLLAANTIEEDIAELIDEKRKVLDSVLDGVDTDEDDLLTALIERTLNKERR